MNKYKIGQIMLKATGLVDEYVLGTIIDISQPEGINNDKSYIYVVQWCENEIVSWRYSETHIDSFVRLYKIYLSKITREG